MRKGAEGSWSHLRVFCDLSEAGLAATLLRDRLEEVRVLTLGQSPHHSFELPELSLRSGCHTHISIAQQSHSNHTAITPQSHINHTAITQQSHRNDTVITQQSRRHHTAITPSSRSNHAVITQQSRRHHAAITPSSPGRWSPSAPYGASCAARRSPPRAPASHPSAAPQGIADRAR